MAMAYQQSGKQRESSGGKVQSHHHGFGISPVCQHTTERGQKNGWYHGGSQKGSEESGRTGDFQYVHGEGQV